MKSISEYFGSGHRSSGTTRSSRSATSRTASIAGSTVSRTYLASLEHVAVLRVVAVRLLEREDRLDELVDQPAELLLQARDALSSSAASSVADHCIAAGSSIVRAIDAAVSASMLSFVTYCSSSTS